MTTPTPQRHDLPELVAGLVQAYIRGNSLPAAEKWGLPIDYPMVSAAHSAAPSESSRRSGR